MKKTTKKVTKKIVEKKYSEIDHIHPGLAKTGHTHSQYAGTGHTHHEYADKSHQHDEYAEKQHDHSEYVTRDELEEIKKDIEKVLQKPVTTLPTFGEFFFIASGIIAIFIGFYNWINSLGFILLGVGLLAMSSMFGKKPTEKTEE